LNPYVYARGNPIGYSDPDGREPVSTVTAIIAVISMALAATDIAVTINDAEKNGWRADHAFRLVMDAVMIAGGVVSLGGWAPAVAAPGTSTATGIAASAGASGFTLQAIRVGLAVPWLADRAMDTYYFYRESTSLIHDGRHTYRRPKWFRSVSEAYGIANMALGAFDAMLAGQNWKDIELDAEEFDMGSVMANMGLYALDKVGEISKREAVLGSGRRPSAHTVDEDRHR
jgi:hypothetical protein